MKEKNTQRGITLIALIITIVILLILAVVTINAMKNGQIIDYAKKAQKDYNDEKAKEETLLQNYLDIINANDPNSKPKGDQLNGNKIIPEGGLYEAADGTIYNPGEKFPLILMDGDNYTYGDYIYTHSGTAYAMTPEEYKIYKEEKREEIKELVLKELESEGITSWDEVVAILTSQNMTEEQFWANNGLPEEMPESDANVYWSVKVIDNSKTQYGPILGKINGSFVMDMTATFAKCSSLVTAPEIPNGVTTMVATFYGCTALMTAPKIPNSVTSLSDMKPSTNGTGYEFFGGGCFSDCVSLTTAPAIPSSVIDMAETFSGCTSLVTAPDMNNATSVRMMNYTFENCTALTDLSGFIVPSGVTEMNGTFKGCTSLTGSISINANPTMWTECLYNTKITSVVGETTMADKILKTVSSTTTNPS